MTSKNSRHCQSLSKPGIPRRNCDVLRVAIASCRHATVWCFLSECFTCFIKAGYLPTFFLIMTVLLLPRSMLNKRGRKLFMNWLVRIGCTVLQEAPVCLCPCTPCRLSWKGGVCTMQNV